MSVFPDRSRWRPGLILMTIPLVLSTIGGQWTRARMKESDAALQAYRAQRPSSQNLPPIVAR